MRRWLAVIAVIGVLASAGCSAPLPGIDRDLTNGWSLPPAAVQWRPLNQTCLEETPETITREDYQPYPCSQRHASETYYVGDLPGATTGSATQYTAVAYAECDKRATVFLGADWHSGRTQIMPVLPGDKGWTAGARWFACEVAEETADYSSAGRDDSLAGALTGDAPLRQRCFNPTVTPHDITAMPPVACAQAHHAEYAGVWTAPNGKLDAVTEAEIAKGCRAAIARFAGLRDDNDLQYRVGYLALPPTEESWTAGDRGVRCYLWLSDETMRGSYQGVGSKKLPINYS